MTDAIAVPVNIYENERELMVAAPMPGVSPEVIEVELTDDRRLRLRSGQHGAGQERIEYLLREWAYGPFERVVDLPQDVDGPRANMSLDNGVLMLTLPKAAGTTPALLHLDRTGHARGKRPGHAGGRGGAAAD